jgi:hypothetical protein
VLIPERVAKQGLIIAPGGANAVVTAAERTRATGHFGCLNLSHMAECGTASFPSWTSGVLAVATRLGYASPRPLRWCRFWCRFGIELGHSQSQYGSGATSAKW